MNVELSNVRKWLIYFREMIQWAQKNTRTNPFIVQAIILGGFPIPSISPKNKLESPTQHLETSEGQPFEATKSTLQDDIQDLHHGGKSCQQRVSEGIYFLSWHLCLLIQRIFFFW